MLGRAPAALAHLSLPAPGAQLVERRDEQTQTPGDDEKQRCEVEDEEPLKDGTGDASRSARAGAAQKEVEKEVGCLGARVMDLVFDWAGRKNSFALEDVLEEVEEWVVMAVDNWAELGIFIEKDGKLAMGEAARGYAKRGEDGYTKYDGEEKNLCSGSDVSEEEGSEWFMEESEEEEVSDQSSGEFERHDQVLRGKGHEEAGGQTGDGEGAVPFHEVRGGRGPVRLLHQEDREGCLARRLEMGGREPPLLAALANASSSTADTVRPLQNRIGIMNSDGAQQLGAVDDDVLGPISACSNAQPSLGSRGKGRRGK